MSCISIRKTFVLSMSGPFCLNKLELVNVPVCILYNCSQEVWKQLAICCNTLGHNLQDRIEINILIALQLYHQLSVPICIERASINPCKWSSHIAQVVYGCNVQSLPYTMLMVLCEETIMSLAMFIKLCRLDEQICYIQGEWVIELTHLMINRKW